MEKNKNQPLYLLFSQWAYFTVDDIEYILEIALEQAVLHWVDEARPVGKYLGARCSQQLSRGGELLLHDFRNNDWLVLNRENFTQGLQKLVMNQLLFPRFNYSAKRYEIILEKFTTDMADLLIQYALFGEYKYDKGKYNEETKTN